MFATTTSRKVLVPFATLVAAGAVAIGSGATFTSDSGSKITATAGDLVHVNNYDGATLTIDNLKPGASETGTLTITNDGSLNSTLKVIASVPGLAEGEIDLAPALEIEIEGDTGDGLGFSGNFADVDNDAIELGALTAGETTEDSITVTVTVTMKDSGVGTDQLGLDNDYQNATAGLDLTFVTTQTDAEADDESVLDGWGF